jgi:hypothetical protein
MKRRRRQVTVPTGTITIRLPAEKIARLKRQAAGALMSTSAYVEALLDADEPELCPSLASLARVIAIYEIVEASEAITSDQLRELKLLVLELAQAAHREADAL